MEGGLLEGRQAGQIQQSAADRLRTANAWILSEIPTRRRFDAAGDQKYVRSKPDFDLLAYCTKSALIHSLIVGTNEGGAPALIYQ